MTTGAHTEIHADHSIANPLKTIGGGKTYAQHGAQADPTNTTLAATVDTLFTGETLRGLRLNTDSFATTTRHAGIPPSQRSSRRTGCRSSGCCASTRGRSAALV
jgi:hypothetical protein